MSNSLTLFNNTLIKLVSRSGTESERQSIVLDVGEFGYTTDSKRLYIGDGVTSGGTIVGNVFKGYTTNILTIGGTPRPGDSVFDTGSKTLYLYKTGPTNSLASWQPVGGFYSSGNGTIAIDSSNNISVSSISANNISRDALGRSLTLSAGRVTLSATIAVNEITTAGVSSLKLPTNLTLGTQSYRLTSAIIPGGYLTTDAAGNLQWSEVPVLTATTIQIISASPIVPVISVIDTTTNLVTAISVFTTIYNNISSTFYNTVSGETPSITLGNGLTGSSGGTSSSTLPVVGNISITPLFAPTAQVSFSQSGSIIRNVGVVSVQAIDITTSIPGDLTTKLNNMYKNFKWGTVRTRYPKLKAPDRPGVFGLYRLTLSQPIDVAKGVVDIRAVNDVFNLDPTKTYFADFHIPTLGHRVLVESSTSILISFHSVAFNTPNDESGFIDAFVLTSGNANDSTRFDVTVYA
jgi:hypothetical protein